MSHRLFMPHHLSDLAPHSPQYNTVEDYAAARAVKGYQRKELFDGIEEIKGRATSSHEALHHFHIGLPKSIIPLFGQASYSKPPPGYERAGCVMISVNIEDQIYGVVHIAEDFATAGVYNACDPDPKCRVMIDGLPLNCKKEIMDLIRAKFPQHHEALPRQAAFLITLKNIARAGSIIDLMNLRAPVLHTGIHELSYLPAGGMASLSFSKQGVPLQFWTHQSRSDVIKTALASKIKKRESTAEDYAKKALDPVIDIFTQADVLETQIDQLCKEHKETNKTIQNQEADKQKVVDARAANEANPKIPAVTKQEVVERQSKEISDIEAKIAVLKGQGQQIENRINQKLTEIEQFRKANFAVLPNSYRTAPFQIALDVLLPSGDSIYKQFNRDGHVVASVEQDQNDPRHVRFSDNVHLSYNSFKGLAIQNPE